MMLKTRVDSYTKGVREKVNRDWTPTQRRQILTLRESNFSTNQIMTLMGATKYQVYNQTRLAIRESKKECRKCGRPLEASDMLALSAKALRSVPLCKKCQKEEAEYKKQRREEALEKGLCGYCYVNPVMPGFCACKTCISATHRRRNKHGLCGNCGINPIGKNLKSLCDECAKLMLERKKEYDKEHKK